MAEEQEQTGAKGFLEFLDERIDARIKALIPLLAEEISARLAKHIRRLTGVRFDPMHPPSDSRGIPHRD